VAEKRKKKTSTGSVKGRALSTIRKLRNTRGERKKSVNQRLGGEGGKVKKMRIVQKLIKWGDLLFSFSSGGSPRTRIQPQSISNHSLSRARATRGRGKKHRVPGQRKNAGGGEE